MSPAPARPRIYHITHIQNLPGILSDGGLLSDARMIARGGPAAGIGMSTIKQRRLSLPVRCHPGTFVGEYVPFYFCPRSIMLYVIRCANHPELAYRGGQEPILHLEADLHRVAAWAAANARWAFSLSNAGATYTEFRDALTRLDELNWPAIGTNQWSDPVVKEGKQAEFLVYDFFPWNFVERIGVKSPAVQAQVQRALAGAVHRPPVDVRADWYY